VRSHAWATNVPPHGAFRGFGSPQTIFGIERHMDQIAKAVGISPEEVRRRIFSLRQRDGYRSVIRDPIDLRGMMDRALKVSDYHAKRARLPARMQHRAQ